MKVSDIMQAMAAAGAPMEAILIAVKAIEAKDAEIAARDALAAEKRAKDAARKRAERDAARTVHGLSTDAARTVQNSPSLSLPPNENNSNPPTHTHPDTTPRARKGHRLTVDWQPSPFSGDLAGEVAAWPVGAIERELARFRDWAASATGKTALKCDWQAAWRNWIRRVVDEGKYRNGAGNSANGGKRNGIADALDREIGFGESAGSTDRRAIGRSPPDRPRAIAGPSPC